MLSDHPVDHQFGRRREDEPGQPVHDQEDEAQGQPAAVGPDEGPRLAPGLGADDSPFRFCHTAC